VNIDKNTVICGRNKEEKFGCAAGDLASNMTDLLVYSQYDCLQNLRSVIHFATYVGMKQIAKVT
jgi:hypothetical protein